VTKFRQNRLTMKGRSAGQRHIVRQTNSAENKDPSGLQSGQKWGQVTGWRQYFEFLSVIWHYWLDDRKGIQPLKTCVAYPRRLFSRTVGGWKQGKLVNQDYLEAAIETWRWCHNECRDLCTCHSAV